MFLASDLHSADLAGLGRPAVVRYVGQVAGYGLKEFFISQQYKPGCSQGRSGEPRDCVGLRLGTDLLSLQQHSADQSQSVTYQPRCKRVGESPLLNGRSKMSHCKGHRYRKGHRIGISFTFNLLQ